MSETSIFSPASEFAAPETAAPSTFDVTQVDRNIRQLNQVQQTWRLPALPETVKLDFASMEGANEDSLLELMLGFDSDLEDEDEPEPSGLILPRDLQPSGMEQVQIILAGASGNKPPTQLSEDAVRLWKRRAIADGYLDMDESRVDSTWSPELNRVRGEMAYDKYNQSLRQPMLGLGITDDPKVDGGVMGLLNDFTSPSGLLSAATELDLFWDFGAINNEISTWGDKWREVGKSKNPWDFAGNLIDAITGPIDDIVFPILNVGLMFTGVGAIANSARVGWQGTRLLEAGNLFGRIYNSGRVGKLLLGGARWGANLDEIGRASWLAGRLQRGGDIASGLGRGLEAWRAWTPTKVAKTITQQGMRMGFAQELENRVPGYQSDGASFADFGPVADAAGFLERAKMSPAAMPFELMLAPYNIFTPGSLAGKTGLLSRVSRSTYKGLGTAGGRAAAGALLGATGGVIAGEDAGDIAEGAVAGAAAGAAAPLLGRGLQTPGVSSALKGAGAGALAGAWLGDDPEDMALGALAGVGLFTVTDTVRDRMFAQMGPRLWDRAVRGVGGVLERTNFAPLADNQRVSLAFDQGMRHRLRNEPERLQQWSENVDKGGVRFALAQEQGGDPNLAAATIGFVYVSAAIDWIASAQAGVAKGSKGWRAPYNAARNKLINQLRQFDPELGITDGVLEDLASAMAWTERGSSPAAAYKRRSQILGELKSDPGRALELMNQHNTRARETIRQLFEPANFPTIADDALPEFDRFSPEQVSLSMGESFASRSLEARGWDLAKYMVGMMDSFGRFPEFAGATDQIRQARLAGLLDGAKLKAFKTRFGTERSVYRVAELEDTEKAAVNSALTDRLLRVDKSKIGNLKATPLAPAHSPASFTVALQGTKTKQDLEELAERVRDIRDAHDHLARVTNPGEWKRQATAVLGLDEAAKLNDLTAEQIKAVIETMPKELGSKKGTGYLIGYAKRHDLSLGELELALQTHADDLANDADLWAQYGLDEFAQVDGKGVYGLDALSARLDELAERIPFTASGVDTDDLVRYLRETGDEAGASQIEELTAGLERDGYQLVHGTEFLMPEDLAHGPIFGDVTRKHLNAATFGNFFRGKLPVEAHILEDRRHRQVISAALAKLGDGLHPDDKKVGGIVRALHDFLEHKRKPLEAMLRDYPQANFSTRAGARYASAVAPIRVDDLSRHGKELRPWLEAKAGLTAKEAEAVWLATHKFRATDFKEVGLYGLEAKLRNTNVLEWGLKTLTGSRYADDWKGKLGGFGAAATVGAVYGGVQTVGQENLSFEDRLAAAVTGAAGGAIGLGAARVGANVLDQAARLAPGANKGMKLADRAAHWQYGYLFDHLAQLRDSLRFTLSPMFDLSRYTEGLFLAQTAAPLRHPKTGERFQLPLDMSPHGLRRALRKEGMTAGQAQAKYREWEGAFQNFAKMRGDFDAEVLDSTGKWFKQLGMLGFSPTDWMSTAYAHMVRGGLSNEQAYEAARQMYTYGTRGRSAAELSTNFIFFPFSFQKKALGHLAKWMKDDLGRSIIIHDALRTYQILDEKYDLDQRWKDHMPFIQQLQRLNLFAFGLSPGRLGGINSQLFESAGKLAWNMFVPVGLDIKNVSAGEEIKDVMHQLTPLLNDIEWMTKNVQETENVLFSPTHVTRSAEIRDGYSEWYDFKKGFEAELERKGYTLNDVMSKPWLEEAKAFYDAKKAELAEKFPAWFEFKTEKAGEIVALQMERQLRLDRAKQAVLEGRQPSPDDFMVAQFEEMLSKVKEDLQLLTGSSDLSNAPSEVLDQVLAMAVDFARQNPRWIQLYEQWYAKELGPLSVVLEIAQ